jgi:hypothetical protein
MPVHQRCPQCGTWFWGSDAIGSPCDRCASAVPQSDSCGHGYACWQNCLECNRARVAELEERRNETVAMCDHLKENVSVYQKAAAYWWVEYWIVKGLTPPRPYTTDTSWQQTIEGACLAAKRIAELERLRSLCIELDQELDGVRLPRSAAAVANGLRAMLEKLDGGEA